MRIRQGPEPSGVGRCFDNDAAIDAKQEVIGASFRQKEGGGRGGERLLIDLEPLMNRRRLTVSPAFALPLGAPAAAFAAYWLFDPSEEVSLDAVDYSFEADGVRNAVMLPARVRLPENMPVVGVSINGRVGWQRRDPAGGAMNAD